MWCGGLDAPWHRQLLLGALSLILMPSCGSFCRSEPFRSSQALVGDNDKTTPPELLLFNAQHSPLLQADTSSSRRHLRTGL